MARKILFPTDGSSTARAAGRVAADIAKGEGDSIVVFAVAEREACEGVDAKPVEGAMCRYMRTVAEDEVAVLEALGVDASAEVVTAASAHEAIVARSQEADVDMIVMGTHGRTIIARAMIGSVADRVVRQSDVPVVLVPMKVGA